jgi:ubiquinone/menaquinone biosynthesis C-methylase UbiE
MDTTMPHLSTDEVHALDPYLFMAVIGKCVIHPGGRQSTDKMFARADFQPGQRVLDIGCGIGTTAIAMARRFAVDVIAADISPIMRARAHANVQAAGVPDRVSIEEANITALPYPDASFDRVVAEAVIMFVDRGQATRELVRICRPGGRVLATEFLWRRPPTVEAREVFFGEICPGMTFDTLDDWVAIYHEAGLESIETTSGPFEMMTLAGFLEDEGFARCLATIGQTLARPAYLKKMLWLMPRMNRTVPYLGYIVITGKKPA